MGEEVKYSSEEVVDNSAQCKLDQLFKKNELHLASDLGGWWNADSC